MLTVSTLLNYRWRTNMKIVILNGSPKGNVSVTMQYINYIKKKFNQHELIIINISHEINKIESNEKYFDSIINSIKSSDGIIWAFPLYTFTVPSNYQRFIELILERKAQYAFNKKYTSILTTSIHFYDHTAINYINSICDDLNMNYVDYFSLHMGDLEKEIIRRNLLYFAKNFFYAIENNIATTKNYAPIEYLPIEHTSEAPYDKLDTSNKKILIIADSLENNNLSNMVNTFKQSFIQDIELINLQDLDIKGGCLGCLKCSYDFKCVYTNKDDLTDLYNNKVKTADIIVFAGTINYRHLSSTWKKFFDRAFYNNHTPSLSGKQIGFILSGPLRQNPNLSQILEAYVQCQYANLAGFVTDEYNTNNEIDRLLHAFSYNIINSAINNYSKPLTFLGVAGRKIFRDEIYGNIRFPFIADHKAFKTLNFYDFPQKNYKSRIMNCIFILLSKFPFIRKEIYSNRMKDSMIQPLKKIVDDETL